MLGYSTRVELPRHLRLYGVLYFTFIGKGGMSSRVSQLSWDTDAADLLIPVLICMRILYRQSNQSAKSTGTPRALRYETLRNQAACDLCYTLN